MTAKRCLVFGGSGAVGGAVCRALVSRGARVALTFRRGEAAETDAIPLEAGSVSDVERVVDAAVQRLGGLDAFVHCAATAAVTEHSGPWPGMVQVGETEWDLAMSVNARSAFFAVRRIAEVMRGGGNVVFVGSLDAAKIVPTPVHYAASQGALRGMTQAMAKELGKNGIRVNLIAAGTLEEGMSRTLPEDLRADYLKHCGLRRLGKVAEIAEVVAWFAIENTYVTGQTVAVDGAI